MRPAGLKPATRPGLFRQTPPAIFPALFGLFGLGLAWRQAVVTFSLPPAISETYLGAVSLLFLFCVAAYLSKAIRRPAVVVEDMRTLPGRAGVAAISIGILLLAVVLVRYDAALARSVLYLGLGLHGLIAVLFIAVLATGPAEQRMVTPAWHLTFVGFVLVPLSALPLGLYELGLWVFYAMWLAAGAIYAVSLRQLLKRDPPPPLRPLLAIHLAPPSVLGLVALLLEQVTLAIWLAGLGALILAALLLRSRYVTAAGFSALWSAFTFPSSAFAGLCLGLANATGMDLFRLAGAILLVAVTFMIPVIAYKVFQAWARGVLGPMTNAAIA